MAILSDILTAINALAANFGGRLSVDPATVNQATAGIYTPGRIYDYNGKLYRFVQFVDGVAYADGQSVEYADATTGYVVTNDRAGGSSIGRVAAGICLRVMTQNYYGFVLVRGFHGTVLTSGADNIAVGECLITHATTDGTVDGEAANALTTAVVGVALAADVDAANTVAAMITVV